MTRKDYRNESLVLHDFRHGDLAAADFRETVLFACDFRGAHLEGATFSAARLIYCDFRGASLQGADMRVRSLRTCNWLNANLDNVIWLANRKAVGDQSCRYNARSSLLRCAIHPLGPCENCQDFELASKTSSTHSTGSW